MIHLVEELLEKEGLILRTPWPPCPGCHKQLSEASRTRDGSHYCAICQKLVIIAH